MPGFAQQTRDETSKRSRLLALGSQQIGHCFGCLEVHLNLLRRALPLSTWLRYGCWHVLGRRTDLPDQLGAGHALWAKTHNTFPTLPSLPLLGLAGIAPLARSSSMILSASLPTRPEIGTKPVNDSFA